MSYYDEPNYTMVPNKLLDVDMADLKRSELAVLLYIVRHTLGFGKSMDAISFKQFMHGVTRHDGTQIDRGTGIKNRTVLSSALIMLEKRGCIVASKSDTVEGDSDVTAYSLSVTQPGTQPGLALAAGGTKNVPRGNETVPRVVRKTYPQKKEIQKKEEGGDTPPTPTAVGEGEEGIALPQFTVREEPIPFDARASARRWSPETVVTTAELASIIGLPSDQDFMEAWAPHVQRAHNEGVPAADLIGCLRWMWSDPAQHWQRNSYTLGVKAIRSQMVTWRGQGRPAIRSVKKTAPSPSAHLAKGGIPRTATATDAALRAAHERLVICDTCHKELGWGTCAACQTRAAQGGLE